MFDDFFAGTQWSRLGSSDMNKKLAAMGGGQPRLAAGSAAGGGGVGVAGGGGGGNARVDQARADMYGLANSRLSAMQNDPMDKMIQDQLQRRMSGQEMPYDATTRNAMFTQQAEMAAAAEKSQMGRIAGNPNDPSYQARVQELQANRQGAMQGARLNIDQKANIENYNARGQALSQGDQFNSGRQNRLTGQSNYISGLKAQEYATSPGGGAAGTGAGPAGQNFIQRILPGGGENRSRGSVGMDNDDFFASQLGSAPKPATSGMVYGSPVRTTAAQAQSAADYEKRLQPGTKIPSMLGWK